MTAVNTQTVTMRDILRAQKRISGTVRKTPLLFSEPVSRTTGQDIFLKCEYRQHTGSFKLRGAANAVLSLTEAERERGVVGVSTGNYGRALAYAASQTGVACIICMSELVPANKVDAVRALGAEVRIFGKSQDEAQLEVDRLVAEKGMLMLPPFDHPDVIAGQGTLGLEALTDCPEATEMLVPLSGGGLAAGVALAIKTLTPETRVIGLSMENGAAMHASLEAGDPVQVEEFPSLADSLGGGIGLDNQHTFTMVRDLVDEVVLLTEDEIAAGIRYLYQTHGEVVEGAGAVGVAGLLCGKVQPKGTTLSLCTGRNIDISLHQRVISGETPDLSQS